MQKPIVSRRAIFDLRATYYYMIKVGRSQASAEAFVDDFYRQAKLVGKFPEMRPLCSDPVLAASGLRSFPVANNYLALYRVVGDEVYVWRVFHQASEYAKLARIDLENDWLD